MKRAVCLVLGGIIAVYSAACSIERTKPNGADCLQDRECVEGLSCQPRPDGRTACAPILDGGSFSTRDVVDVFTVDATDVSAVGD